MSFQPQTPSIGRRNRKWAMIAVKGGKCVSCGKIVTDGKIELFQFHHKIQVNNHNDKTDRWGGGVCDWKPFTEQWFDWANRVELICKDCHLEEHRGKSQLSIDFSDVQNRLDGHECVALTGDQFGLRGLE